jgi:hypothetical protein
MKIKKLLLIAFLGVFGMNAYAAVTYGNFAKDNVSYYVVEQAEADGGNQATVLGVLKGKLTPEMRSIVIPATVTDANTNKTYKVVGFDPTWQTGRAESETDTYATMNVDGEFNSLQSLTIGIDNMGIPAADALPVSLTSLELKGTKAASYTIPNYTGTLVALATLDLDGLSVTGDGNKITLTKQTAGDKLTAVTLPAGIEVPEDAFNGSSALTTIDLSKATKIGKDAFVGTSITTADLSAAAVIGAGAFKDVTTITAITLGTPAGGVTINASAFEGCTGVTTLTIPAGVAYTDGNQFKGMTALATVTINNAAIPATAFAEDAAITSLTIANAELAAIPAGAFADATGLTVVDLSKCPEVVAEAGSFAANKFTKVKLAGSKTPYANINLANAAATLKTITFSSVNNAIAAGAFKGYTKLASVTLPKLDAAELTLNKGAFQKCTALATITIPAGTTLANGDNALADLEELQLGGVFAGCSALATVVFEGDETALPTTIGDYTFEGTALTEVRLPDNVNFNFTAGDPNTYYGVGAFKDCATLKKFIGGRGMTFVPQAFEGCNGLKTVSIPGTVAEIVPEAFKGLAKLATVTFNYGEGDELDIIGESAFEDCVALTAIDLSLTQLDNLDNENVFKGCTALATIKLPAEMNSLRGASIFEGTAIAKLDASMVGWDGTMDGDDPVPSVVNIFGSNEENPNVTLKTLKLGDAVIAEQAFAYCQKLKTVTVEAPAEILDGAFDHCSALTTFTYAPEDALNLGFVGETAFSGCTPYVLFDTNNNWVDAYPKAPLNTTYPKDLVPTTVKTVQDKANANQFVAKFASPSYNVIFNADDVKLYSVYVDGETAYFQALRTRNGKYFVSAFEHVILKTEAAAEVSFTIDSYADNPWVDEDAGNCLGFDDVQCLYVDGELADIQDLLGMGAGDYLYRLTNTASQGFGFTSYTGKDIKANQFFVSSTKKPADAARLNVVWLDEDGNVETDATAIKSIKNANSSSDAIYNLQGVRVQKAQKGLYIQNGKKFAVK